MLASIIEQISTNSNYLQPIARERLRCHLVKSKFCKYEKHRHWSLQIGLQTFLLSLLINPAPNIHIIPQLFYLSQPKKQLDEDDKIVEFTVLLAYLNMPEYQELHFQHKNQSISVTPCLLLEQNLLSNIYVKNICHIHFLPAKLSNIIQFYLFLWEEVNLIIDIIPPEHFEDIIYQDPVVYNIILDKKSYSSPPLPPGSIPLPTLKDI